MASHSTQSKSQSRCGQQDLALPVTQLLLLSSSTSTLCSFLTAHKEILLLLKVATYAHRESNWLAPSFQSDHNLSVTLSASFFSGSSYIRQNTCPDIL